MRGFFDFYFLCEKMVAQLSDLAVWLFDTKAYMTIKYLIDMFGLDALSDSFVILFRLSAAKWLLELTWVDVFFSYGIAIILVIGLFDLLKRILSGGFLK